MSAINLAPPRAVLALDFPDRRLSINAGNINAGMRARLRDAAKENAGWAAKEAIPADDRPLYAAGIPLVVIVRLERPRNGKVWDAAGIIEALKPAADALNGYLWHDDAQIVGWLVEWDEKPTKRARIHLAAYEVKEIAQWPRPHAPE